MVGVGGFSRREAFSPAVEKFEEWEEEEGKEFCRRVLKVAEGEWDAERGRRELNWASASLLSNYDIPFVSLPPPGPSLDSSLSSMRAGEWGRLPYGDCFQKPLLCHAYGGVDSDPVCGSHYLFLAEWGVVIPNFAPVLPPFSKERRERGIRLLTRTGIRNWGETMILNMGGEFEGKNVAFFPSDGKVNVSPLSASEARVVRIGVDSTLRRLLFHPRSFLYQEKGLPH